MQKRKLDEVLTFNKRLCKRSDTLHLKLIFNKLPYEIIIHILNFLDIVEFKHFQIEFPIINIFTKFINFEKNHINNKDDMLIKAFDMKNMNIIEFVFNNIKYSNNNQIFITFELFNQLIADCSEYDFFQGIEYLIKWKDEHCRKYKISKYFNNTQSVENIIEEYNSFENNDTNLFEIIIIQMIFSNNIELFDYLINNHRLYKNRIIELIDFNIEDIIRFDYDLIFNRFIELNTDSTVEYFEDLYNFCVIHDSLKCMNVLLKPHNNFKFRPGITNICYLLINKKNEMFQIVYNNDKIYYNLEKLSEIVNNLLIITLHDIKHLNSVLFVLERFDGLLDYIVNDKTNIFLENILHTYSKNKYELLEVFGNPKYIKLETILSAEKDIIDDIIICKKQNYEHFSFIISLFSIIKLIKKKF